MGQEPESLILQLLRDMRTEITNVRGDVAFLRDELKSDILALRAELKSDMRSLGADLKSDIHSLRDELKSDMHSLRADAASDLLAAEAKAAQEHRQTREQIVGLRLAVIAYHSTVVGHGILISDLEARVRRMEQHLGLLPPEAH